MIFRKIILCVTAAGFSALVLAAVSDRISAWKEDFPYDGAKGEKLFPKGWDLKTKIGIPAAEIYIAKEEKDNTSFLRMESDRSSATIVRKLEKIDLRKTPILRWRWKANVLPEGADGRDEKKDDQAIGIYMGNGNIFLKKSVSYRWDTDTPKGLEGNCVYGAGTIKIRWFTLRNKEDVSGEWFTEERNVAEDFHNAWGYYPEDIYVSVSCNSQYTGGKASADLNWIEITSVSTQKDKK
ncbi:MAG: DUF3047 domain-containing protein [Victivallales bacterium]